MECQTNNQAPCCYLTRVDLTDKLGERLIKLQKRREGRAKAQANQLAEWWNEGDKQDNSSDKHVAKEEEDEVFTVAPEDRELAAQMAALGLPTLLGGGSKHEARALEKRKGRHSKERATSNFVQTDSGLRTSVEADPGSPHGQNEDADKQSEEAPSSSCWQPVWDADYCAFYWFNSETQQSQWEVPEGCEQSAAALYAFDQDVAYEGVSSEGRLRDVFSACEEDVQSRISTVRSVEKAGVAREDTFVQAAREGAGSPSQDDSLRGMPRPCGQHIRFEESSDAEEKEERAADCRALEEPRGENLMTKDGSERSAKDIKGECSGEGTGRGELKTLEVEPSVESTLDAMDVDDPMEIDSMGGEYGKSRNVMSLSEPELRIDIRTKQPNVVAGIAGQSVKGGGDNLLLSRREASCLGESLLEAAQEQTHGHSRSDEDSLFERKAKYCPAEEPRCVQQKTHEREVQRESLEAPTSPLNAASPLVLEDSRKAKAGKLVLVSALEHQDELVKASMGEPPVHTIEDGPKVEQVKELTTTEGAGLEVVSTTSASIQGAAKLITSASMQGAEKLMTSAAGLGGALKSIPMTSSLAVPGAGGDAGGAMLTSASAFDGHEKPADVGQKYWFQRYRLFSKFDQGVRLDPEGWYSVTPEAIAIHHAKRCKGRTVIDAFAGVGGNAIQMATGADWVIAIDMDPGRLALAEHNARVYGVRHKIEFIAGDFFKLAPHLKADALFLSPPWGGPEYNLVEMYDLDTMLQPVSGVELFKAGLQITSNIALFLPRNVDTKQLQELAWLATPPLSCEIESNYLCGKLKCVTAYYGDLVNAPNTDQ